VLSKKPEIRWKREPEDILELVNLQRELLEKASTLVKDGGVIVYSTCSTEQEENMDNIKDFLDRHPEFKIDNASKFIDRALVNEEGCVETFPHRHGIDGSFAARLIKTQ
jgi:16S rRNA (cytosine967-C5)-methyltransferase